MTQSLNTPAPFSVTGKLNYVQRKDEILYNYYHVDPPEGRSQSNEVFEAHEVSISSIRDIPGGTQLDTEGFELIEFTTRANDIYDTKQRTEIFFPEVASLVLKKTGASEVRVYDAFLRGEEAQRRFPGSISAPAGSVHVDYTHESGPDWFDRVLKEDADRLRGRRFAVINVWRPLTGPLTDHPLAVCDARTTSKDDFMTSQAITRVDANGLHSDTGELTISEIYSVAWNQNHRWYYVPEMTTNEALLLKNYDSETQGVSRFTPHSAFVDPTAPAAGLPRASIEVRVLTVW